MRHTTRRQARTGQGLDKPTTQVAPLSQVWGYLASGRRRDERCGTDQDTRNKGHSTVIVRVLMACPDSQFKPWFGCPCVGRLLTPQSNFGQVRMWHEWTAIDNAAYTDWKPERFRNLLLTHSRNSRRVKWVCCPDVVGDWTRTRERFDEWEPTITRLGYTVAYVLQDGQPETSVPWDRIGCVFLGGTNAYKETEEARALLVRARKRGKLVHVGRVNTLDRVRLFLPVMDTFDGLSFSFYSKVHMPTLIELLNEHNTRSTNV